MSEESDAILISVLVIVCVILIFQVEIYRNILSLVTYYVQESPLPPELRFSSSFLAPSTDKSKHPIKNNL
jgi:hypothetical protein